MTESCAMAKRGIRGRDHYFQISADKYPEHEYAKKFVCYWHKIERKFRLRRAVGSSGFVLNFKHDTSNDFIYDDGTIIENIANFYGYQITREVLLPTKSVYTFAKKNPKT